MLTNLFESRNKMFLNLVKLGDYLGRSLRENVELFSVDDGIVTYLTESNKIIKGNYDKTALKLTDVIVQDANIFENKEVYSQLVDKKVNGFLAEILENDLPKVQESFESVLNLWETRLHFDRVQNKLRDKIERFDERLMITSTPEFQRVTEIKNDLVKLLKESSQYVNIPEIRNTIKLSSVISKSFNLPKLTYEALTESSTFEIPKAMNSTLYDHLCKQELIAKELVESKDNLENIWIMNEKIQKLPSYIYESDDNVMQLVAEILTDLPYFAMATKKQITSLVESNLDLLIDQDVVPSKDIKEFVAKIYEFKRPVKNHIVEVLNEKYGINIQNLTDAPTFDSLVKTQILIFESLSKLSPKNSVLKKTLHDFSEVLKEKTGIEAIDISDFLNEIFTESEYSDVINETTLMNYLNFDKVADDLGKIGQVLKMIQAGMGMGAGGAPMGGAAAPMAGGMGAPQGANPASQMAQQVPQGEGEYETDGGSMAGMDDLAKDSEAGDVAPAMDAEDAASQVQGEEAAEEGGPEMPDMGGEEGEEGSELENAYGDEAEFTDKEELVDNLRELEGLIASLKDEMGMGEEGDGEEGGEFGAEGEEEVPPEEGEEGEETAPISDFTGGDEEGKGEDEEFEEDEEEAPPAKPKKKKSKPEE